jgi:hypothetical protein
MRVPIGSGGWYLGDWSDRADLDFIEFRGSETLAQQWAYQLRSDVFALDALRRLLGGAFPPLSDEQIARAVACRLTSGTWVARRGVTKWVATGGATVAADAAAFPKEDRRSQPPARASGPIPDAALFPGDTDPVAIAEAQKRAAALGIPFCEECLKAQMAGK